MCCWFRVVTISPFRVLNKVSVWVVKVEEVGRYLFPLSTVTLGACYTQALPRRRTGWDTQALLRVFTLFWIPQKSVIKSSHPKKFQYLKFQTPKNPLIIPVNWNQESKSEKKQDGNEQQATEYLPKCKRHTGKFVTHITKENCNKKMSFKNSS